MTETEKNEYPKVSNGLITGTLVAFAGGIALLMSFCSPYWIESYEGSLSAFKNMGLWEYCFKEFQYPYFQLPKYFDGCHNVFSHEYYVIREWLVPGWLMVVQAFVTVSFLLTFTALAILSLEIIRWPLKCVLQYEWILTQISFFCCAISSGLLFLSVAIFGGNAYRRDWLMYPKFNVLSWSYALAVVAFIFLALASLVLYQEYVKAYELRSEAKNLVMQMEMQEEPQGSGLHAAARHHSRHPQGGYI